MALPYARTVGDGRFTNQPWGLPLVILMTQRQFAEHVGFSAWTVSQWAERGWLVLCDNKIDAGASVQRLKERRPGGLKKMTRRAAAKISHWSGKRGMTS